jgi:hypothetical protein
METSIALAVPKIMALPRPWSARAVMSRMPEGAKLHRKEVVVKRMMPLINIFFLPTISANLPIGTRKTAVERRNIIATQPKDTIFMPNSQAIKGRARLIELPIKGVRKLQSENIKRILYLLVVMAKGPEKLTTKPTGFVCRYG